MFGKKLQRFYATIGFSAFLSGALAGFGLALAAFYYQDIQKEENYTSDLHKTDAMLYQSDSGGSVNASLKNVRLFLNEKIFFDIPQLYSGIFPKGKVKTVVLDNPNRYFIKIYHGEVHISVPVLEYIFNSIVFHYKDSRIKNLSIRFPENGSKKSEIILSGKLRLVIWVPFELTGILYLEKENGFIVIEVRSIKSMGNPYTKNVMNNVGLNLESLLRLPPSRGVEIKKNRIYISPFKLLPPPYVSGKIDFVKMNKTNTKMILSFHQKRAKNRHIFMDEKKNHIRLKGGKIIFGRLKMSPTDILIIDSYPENRFLFSVNDYRKTLRRSNSYLNDNYGIVTVMPDYSLGSASNK